MILFYAGVGIILLGLGIVAWLIIDEKKKTDQIEEKIAPQKSKISVKAEEQSALEMLNRLGLTNKNPQPNSSSHLTSTGTVSLTTTKESSNEKTIASPERDTKAIEEELRLKTEYSDLKEKYERLEKLFNEKNLTLEKTEKTLANELKIRKDFNKVKDLLEKELKETKEKTRDLQIQLTSFQAEIAAHQKRISQQEEKIKQLEKQALKNDDTISEQTNTLKEKDKKLEELSNTVKERDSTTIELRNVAKEKQDKIDQLTKNLEAKENQSPDSQTQQDTATVDDKASQPIPEPTEIPLKKEDSTPSVDHLEPEKEQGGGNFTAEETNKTIPEPPIVDPNTSRGAPEPLEPTTQDDAIHTNQTDPNNPKPSEPLDQPSQDSLTPPKDNNHGIIKLAPDILKEEQSLPNEKNPDENSDTPKENTT